ncbi:MAG: DUF5979 domain-containing protein, partial [Nakamurella sp.]
MAVLVLALSTVGATVAPVPDASAATISLGTIAAQQADQRGQDSGTGGNNCITYAPVLSASSSALVASPNEAQTGHGSSTQNRCPSALSTTTQSVVGFRPAATASTQDGVPFLIGRMIHYNNPVYANDRYFSGTLNTVLGGFTAPNTLSFPWQLDETPNTGGNNCCNDEISFTSQISAVALTQRGLSFRLVIQGFVPVGTSTACPATPGGDVKNDFSTVEGTQTHACLYASLVQLRTLSVTKTVVGTPPGTPTFNYTSTSLLAGSAWSNSSFALNPGGSVSRELVSGNTVTVTETDPGDDRWSLTSLTCKQFAANGVDLVDVPGATLNTAARQLVLTNIPAPLSTSKPGITCAYANTYTPKATLTLVKKVNSGSATPNQWTLTATGSGPPPSGFAISGPSGEAAVTAQRVPAGSYALTEIGTGSASTGYLQDGSWVCKTGAGGAVPVTAGSVTLANSATGPAGAVICTVANRFAVGSLQIAKIVDAPPGAYTGGTGKTFAGSYDCGTGNTGTFSTLTTAVPVTIGNIPAGSACTVTEDAPTGGLANASYAWGNPTYTAQPVTITDNGTAVVTITNPVVQKFGSFSMTKTVAGPGGYTGGTGRVFPVGYSCTLANGPTTAGSLNLTTAQAVSPAAPLPTGSVCAFTETLGAQDGDFSDPSYAWSGYTLSPQTVTIGDNTTATSVLTNTYTRNFSSLTIAKSVLGSGYTGGGDPHFVVAYDCGVPFVGTRTLADGGSTVVAGLPVGAVCGVAEQDGGVDPNLWPSPTLLDPAHAWGSPTWAPSNVVTIAADGSTSVIVSNPTVPIFGKVSVTKGVSGEIQGIVAGATFEVTVSCQGRDDQVFDLAVGATASTGDIPVGTACSVTETAPTGGLLDPSYSWGPTPADQQVTVPAS